MAAQGAQTVAQKQREVMEAGLREAATLAREYKPLGKVHENLALQTEFARKVFDIAVEGRPGQRVDRATVDHGCGQDHPGPHEGKASRNFAPAPRPNNVG